MSQIGKQQQQQHQQHVNENLMHSLNKILSCRSIARHHHHRCILLLAASLRSIAASCRSIARHHHHRSQYSLRILLLAASLRRITPLYCKKELSVKSCISFLWSSRFRSVYAIME
jgi:hypothetical protein